MSSIQHPNRMKIFFKKRWSDEDYPGAEARFQIHLLAKDFAIYVLLPFISIILFKSCESAWTAPKKSTTREKSSRTDTASGDHSTRRSQIIDFTKSAAANSIGGIIKTTAGALVRVRLLNVVETYSNAPVHAQIIDAGLGKSLIGATLVGDAVSDSSFNRININFSFVRATKQIGHSIPIAARALSLNGTLGLNAQKKEGFFARAALNSSGAVPQDAQGSSDNKSLRQVLLRAFGGGILQEFSTEAQIEKSRAQVLSLKPNTEFYVELTDTFPSNQ